MGWLRRLFGADLSQARVSYQGEKLTVRLPKSAFTATSQDSGEAP